MTEAVPDQRLFQELWISFVALIRSYVAGYDLGRATGHTLLEANEADLSIQSPRKRLDVRFDSRNGKGVWAVSVERELENGNFQFARDSQVRLSDRRGTVDMEIAAEALTAKVLDEE